MQFVAWLAIRETISPTVVLSVQEVMGGPLLVPGHCGSNTTELTRAPGPAGRHGCAGVTVRGYERGDAKLTQTQDLGTFSPAVQPGRRYLLRLSCTADVPTQLSLYYRANLGEWQNGRPVPSWNPPETSLPRHGQPLRFPKAQPA